MISDVHCQWNTLKNVIFWYLDKTLISHVVIFNFKKKQLLFCRCEWGSIPDLSKIKHVQTHCLPKQFFNSFPNINEFWAMSWVFFSPFYINSDHYAFVTFEYTCDAYACIKGKNDTDFQIWFDNLLCFHWESLNFGQICIANRQTRMVKIWQLVE